MFCCGDGLIMLGSSILCEDVSLGRAVIGFMSIWTGIYEEEEEDGDG